MAPIIAIYLLWLVWLLAWVAAFRWTNPAARRVNIAQEIIYRLLVIVGATLLFGYEPIPRYDMVYRFWDTLYGTWGWSMFALCLAGFIVTWWARFHLSQLWTGHGGDARTIDTGPYALVRHPAYSSLIVASLATAAVLGTPWTLVGAIVMSAGFVLKATLEERFLRSQVGADTYDTYARRVPMLVPFWPNQLWPSPPA